MCFRNIYLVTVKTKSGPSIVSAFRSLFHDQSRRPVWVRKGKGKEILNNQFQDVMLRHEGIQFQVWKNPDVKSAVVERAPRTIRDRLQVLYV